MRVRQAVATFRGHHVPNINFIGRKVWWFALSGTFILISIVGLLGPGLKFSIEFNGGSILQLPDRSGASVADYERVLAGFGIKDPRVEILGGGTVQIRTESLTELGFSTPVSPSPSPSASISPTPSASA